MSLCFFFFSFGSLVIFFSPFFVHISFDSFFTYRVRNICARFNACWLVKWLLLFVFHHRCRFLSRVCALYVYVAARYRCRPRRRRRHSLVFFVSYALLLFIIKWFEETTIRQCTLCSIPVRMFGHCFSIPSMNKKTTTTNAQQEYPITNNTLAITSTRTTTKTSKTTATRTIKTQRWWRWEKSIRWSERNKRKREREKK